MLSRLRLPANQFSKCLVQQTSRTVHGVYTTSNRNFLPSRVLQRKQFGKFMDGTRDFQLLRKFRTNAPVEMGNSKTDSRDATRSLLFLKNTEIAKLLDEARKEDSNPIHTSPLSIIMRPISKISAIKEDEMIPPEDVETELYDVQYIMDPSYQEVLYQQVSKRIHIVSEDFNTSGQIIWNVVQ